jgi:hypothetical protein
MKQNEKEPLLEDSQMTSRTVKKPPRLQSLDTFRGFALFMMIFVNYGGEIFDPPAHPSLSFILPLAPLAPPLQVGSIGSLSMQNGMD